MSRHSWQGHFGPDVVSRSWPDFEQISRVVVVSTDDPEPTLACWRGAPELLGAGVVAGPFARAKAVAHICGGRPVGPDLVYRPYLKLVAYVPTNAVHRVRGALAAAGAGRVGAHSHTTFAVAGTGTVRPGPGTRPGSRAARLEYVDEVRLETILPTWLEDDVVDRLLAALPQRDVAYDLYPLANRLVVPQAFLSDDGVVRTADITREIAAWAITTGVRQLEAEQCHDKSRLELARHGIAVSLVPLGHWTVPGLKAVLAEVYS